MSESALDLRIDSVDFFRVRLDRREPFVIATGISREATNVIVRIRSGGLEGIGAAAPNSVTGETPESIERFLAVVGKRLLKVDAGDVSLMHELMDRLAPGNPAAASGVDLAAHDLAGKARGLPVCQLLGSCRESIETSMTIGITDLESTVGKSVASVQAGFKALKIKIGLDLDDDLRRVEAVRDAVGPGIKLRVDCNQGFDREGAKRLVKALASVSVEFVEQPVPAGDWTSLREVAELSPVPIMADESVKTMDDLLKLVRGRHAHMLNLKLSKCGGIYPAVGMSKLCEVAEIRVQVGCMAECQAAIAGGLHVALSQRAVAYADLDSHFSFENDPTRGVEFKAGRLYARKAPGLGVELVGLP